MTVLKEPPATRQAWAEELLDRLTPIMSVLGLLFLLLVVGESLAAPGSTLAIGLAIANAVLWLAFVAEFVARLFVAPDRGRFLRRNWWQVVFLVLPFLRFLRLLRTLRILRTGRVLSSAVRSSRSARRLLGDRMGWLGMLTGIVILSGSQLLYQFGDYPSYGLALHDAALAAIAGEPLVDAQSWLVVVELALVVFSVVVFATLAGALGAYFLHRTAEREPPTAEPPGGGVDFLHDGERAVP